MSPALERNERSDWSMARDLWPYLRPDAWLYVAALLTAPLTAAMVVVRPWLLQRAIDEHIVVGDLTGLQVLAWWFFAAVVADFVLQTLHTLAISYGAMRSITRVRSAVFAHTLRTPQSVYDRTPTGRLLTRVTNDVEALGETLSAGAVTIVLDALQVLGVLVAMFWLNARLTLVLLLVGPPLAWCLNRLRQTLRTLYLEVQTSMSELNAFVSERLDGVQVIQLYRDERRTLAAFDERLGRYRDATVRTNLFDALLYAVVDGLGTVTMALVLWYGSGSVFDGALTAGLLAAFIDYVSKLFRPIQEFSQKIAVLQRASAALTKIFSVLDDTSAITPGSITLEQPRGHLVLRDVRFAYGDGPDVLKGIDLEVRPGEVVALCGRTGSGKSTIGKLLTRAYDGYRGSILLDGHELRDLTPASVRRAVGEVRQDAQLFTGDLRFNLSLGTDRSDAELERAVAMVHADRVVQRLGGLGGQVDEGGRNLSSGEAQLLSFARTMAHDPPIVLLDEATASVDSLTEALVQQATEAILAHKTTVVIAHRLSTIMNADRIAVLDAGAVIEQGSHAELLALDGAYAELFRQQFRHAEAG
jgi:ATP-binding cassette subfamily B multidrug efflux pump